MKLIKKTHQTTAIWLLPIIIVGSIFCYHMISYISYEETDEYLSYEMQRLIEYHNKYNDIPDFHKISNIVPDKKCKSPYFKDTLMLESGDNEIVPYRELFFGITHDGKNYTITLRHLLLGKDDIWEGTILIIIGLISLFAITIFFVMNRIANKIWQPFYKTLNTLTNYKISTPVPQFIDSNIDEFNTLNTTAKTLLNKISADYRNNKEFNENASHELQTELAIIKANAEKMINKIADDDKNIKEIRNIYTAAGKLSQTQKSLLLLSKISNREFQDKTQVDIAETIKSSIELFSEYIKMRNIRLDQKLTSCIILIDKGLADTMINNLIKNAIKHNLNDGFITINLTESTLTIENSGEKFDDNPATLLNRFTKNKSNGSGIGLAIVKQICEIFDFEIIYTIDNLKHKISIIFKKSN